MLTNLSYKERYRHWKSDARSCTSHTLTLLPTTRYAVKSSRELPPTTTTTKTFSLQWRKDGPVTQSDGLAKPVLQGIVVGCRKRNDTFEARMEKPFRGDPGSDTRPRRMEETAGQLSSSAPQQLLPGLRVKAKPSQTKPNRNFTFISCSARSRIGKSVTIKMPSFMLN